MRLLSLLCCFLSVFYCHAQNDDLETIKMSMLTVDGGDELYSTFGHTAVRVYDTQTMRSQVYNYGTFDTEVDGFYVNFLRGKLPYKLALQDYGSFLRENNYRKRTVWEQNLDLSNDDKRKVLDFLIENLKPQNLTYQYDFFFDNCSTRAIDVFNILGLKHEGQIENITLRQMLKTHLKGKPFESFGIDLVIGSLADKKTSFRDQNFLPIFLHKFLNETTKNGKPLVTTDFKILKFEEEGEKRNKKQPNYPYYLGFFFLLIRFILAGSKKGARIYDYIWLSIGAIVSLILLFMWFLTDHVSCVNNWNVLWATPLLIPFIFVSKKIKRILAIPILICLVASIINAYGQYLPQFFNQAIIPFCILLGWAVIKRSWTIMEDIL